MPQSQLEPKYIKNNWYLSQPIKLRITKKIYNYKSHSLAGMMLFTWVPFLWDHLFHRQLKLYLILVLSTWQSPHLCVTIKHLEISNLRNLIPSQAHLCKEISLTKDVNLKPMTCTSLIQTKFCQKLHPNLHTVQPNYRVLFGKITHACNNYNSKMRRTSHH